MYVCVLDLGISRELTDQWTATTETAADASAGQNKTVFGVMLE